ncbi:MAG: hypothetical protein U1F46_00105 [Marinagarivorans sp.]
MIPLIFLIEDKIIILDSRVFSLSDALSILGAAISINSPLLIAGQIN